MDGVDEYLPTRTMTAEELARHRLPKRKQNGSGVGDENTTATTEGDILMQGRPHVWPGTRDDETAFDSFSDANMFS